MNDFILNTLGTWLINLLSNYPAFGTFVMIIGFLRLCVKPLMTMIRAYVEMTPYDSDDKWLNEMEASKGYKLFVYLMDWLLSIKVPEKK